MDTNSTLAQQIAYFAGLQEEDIQLNQAALEAELVEQQQDGKGAVFSVLSVLGGFFASLLLGAALAIPLLSGSESSYTFLGLLFCGIGLAVNFVSKNMFTGTAVVTLYLSGAALLIFSLLNEDNTDFAPYLLLVIASIGLVFSKNKVFAFVNACLFIVSAYAIFFQFHSTLAIASFHVLLLLAVYAGFTKEALLLSKSSQFNFLLAPAQVALALAFVYFNISGGFSNLGPYGTFENLLLIGAQLVLLILLCKGLLERHSIETPSLQTVLYMGGALLPLVFSAEVLALLFLLLLSYSIRQKLVFGLALIALPLALIHYYYFLNISLLYKSLLLLCSGLFLLALYRHSFVNSKRHENV